MNIYLVRHTKVDVDKSICYGQTDVGLAESFVDEYSKLIKELPEDFSKLKVYSSPLKRCRLLAEKLSGSVEINPELKELNFGDWELKKWKDFPKEELEKWSNNLLEFNPPNGESFSDLFKRVIKEYEKLKKIPGDKIIVSHGGPIRIIIAYILEIPLQNIFRVKIDYGSVSKIILSEKIKTIEYLNR